MDTGPIQVDIRNHADKNHGPVATGTVNLWRLGPCRFYHSDLPVCWALGIQWKIGPRPSSKPSLTRQSSAQRAQKSIQDPGEDVYPDFPLDLTRFFGDALIPIFGDQDAGILGFHSHIIIVNFNAERVSLKLQVTNVRMKEVTKNLNSKP